MSKLYQNIKNSLKYQVTPKMPDTAWQDFLRYKRKQEKGKDKIFPSIMMILFTLSCVLLLANLFMDRFRAQQNSQVLLKQSDRYRDTVFIYKPNPINNESNPEQGNYISRVEYQQLKTALNKLKSRYNHLKYQLSSTLQLHTPGPGFSTKYLNSTQYAQNTIAQYFPNTKISSTKIIKNTTGIAFPKLKYNVKNSISGISSYLQYPDYRPSYGIGRPYYFILINRYNKNRKHNVLSYLTPKSLTIGLHAGFVSIYNPRLSTSAGPGFGFSVGSLFSKKIRGVLCLDRINTTGIIDDHSKFGTLPYVTPPENGTLREIYYDTKLTNLSIALDYLFPSYWRIRPFTGLSLYYSFIRNNELNYEYYTPQGEVYKQIKPKALNYNNHSLGIRLGFDINLTDNIDAYLLGTFQPNINGNSGSLYYISPGLYYHF